MRFRFKGQEGQKIAQTARLLLLIVMYWLLLLYPVIYRIYTRASQGTHRSAAVCWNVLQLLIYGPADEITGSVEQQVTCSATTGTAWYALHLLLLPT